MSDAAETIREYRRRYYEKNKERIKAASAARYAEKREEICAAERAKPVTDEDRASRRKKYRERIEHYREQKRAWTAANPEKVKESKRREYAKSAEVQKQKATAWARANPERARARKRAYKASEKGRANRAKPHSRVSARMRKLVRYALRGGKGGKSWMGMVDYTPQDLIAHLERQFLKGMGWHNMSQWHIDHIVPLASFNYTAPEDPEFKRAWALTNLRPLWAEDNMRKGAKIECLL